MPGRYPSLVGCPIGVRRFWPPTLLRVESELHGGTACLYSWTQRWSGKTEGHQAALFLCAMGPKSPPPGKGLDCVCGSFRCQDGKLLGKNWSGCFEDRWSKLIWPRCFATLELRNLCLYLPCGRDALGLLRVSWHAGVCRDGGDLCWWYNDASFNS